MPPERRPADDLAELVDPERQVPLGGDRRRPSGAGCPAAALRGLTNSRPPAASAASFIRSKLATGRYTSPRTSMHVGHDDARTGLQPAWHGGDRRHVGRHVLADAAVAARRRLHVAPALVADAHRHAVDLQLADVADGLAGKPAGDALTPRRELLARSSRCRGSHRHRVDDRGEQRARRAADVLGRRRVDEPARDAPPPARAAPAPAGRSRRRRSPGRRARGSGGCGRRRARSRAAIRAAMSSSLVRVRRRRSRRQRLGPEGEPAGDRLLVDPAPDLARQADHPIGDRWRVQPEPAVRRDEAALAQQRPDRSPA